MAGLAILSSIEIDHVDHLVWTVHFEVGPIMLGASALIWLPAVLRLLSPAGGRIKGAGVELYSGGLIGTPEGLISDLTQIRTGAEEVTRPRRMARRHLEPVDIARLVPHS